MKSSILMWAAMRSASRFGVLLSVIGMASLVYAQTPVAHWTFDEGLDNFNSEAIDSINGNDGIWQAETKANLGYTAGILGGAVRLQGNLNEFFLVDSIPELNGIQATPPFPNDPVLGVGATWMAWINVSEEAGSGYNGIVMTRSAEDLTSGGVNSNRNWGLAWQNVANNPSRIDSRVGNAPVASSANSIVPGQWHHVALVWGNADASFNPPQPAHQLYIDGNLVNQNASSGIFELISSGSWALGSDPFSAARTFNGLLDDIAVFDLALTSAQVEQKYNDGLAGIDAAGNATGRIDVADVNGDGFVTIDDFNIIRDNLGMSATSRSVGDITGNRRVDLDDFQLWLHSAPPELAALALAVPEPSSLGLIGLAVVLGLSVRRTRKFSLASLLLATTIGVSATSVSAQDLILQIDRETGEASLTGASSHVVSLAGYGIFSQRETIVPGAFSGLRDTDPDWVLAGIPSASEVFELNSNGDPLAATFIDQTVSFGLGAIYEPSQAILSAGFGVDVEQNDLSLMYYDTVIDATFTGVVEFVGEKTYNNLGIIVDLSDGTAILKNESPFNLVVTGYLIEAGESGGLNTDAGTFNGVGGSFQAPSVLNGHVLGELDPTGNGVALNGGASINLGVIGQAYALDFSFLLAGADEASREGFVKYVGLDGDFDGNGVVDGFDFLAWQRGGSPDPLSATDLAIWEANFGVPLGGGNLAAVQAVPEPCSALLSVAAVLCVFATRRSNLC